MKKRLFVLPLLLGCMSSVYGMYEFYTQQAPIVVYATDTQAKSTIDMILKSFSLNYAMVDTLNTFDDTVLYILAGNVDKLDISVLPKHYIVYQMYNVGALQGPYMRTLQQASVIWDAHWSNINNYKNRINHWYYLPNAQYEFVDPVVLASFLPVRALSTYRDLLAHSNVHNTDFSSHLPVLFCHCFFHNPGIFIESGIRWGDGSTIALGKITQLLNDAHLVGLDIDNCARHYAHLRNAHFLQMNDVQFPAYFPSMGFKNDKVDFVFIDTSHQYEHTLKEIAAFSSILADNGAITFHDSNVAIHHPVRINGTACYSGLGNPKGVTDGLKTYFNLQFDEGRYLNTYVEKDGYLWNLVNYPYCYGFAVAKRIRKI